MTQRFGEGAGEKAVWYGSVSPEMSVLDSALSLSDCLSLASSTDLFPYLPDLFLQDNMTGWRKFENTQHAIKI